MKIGFVLINRLYSNTTHTDSTFSNLILLYFPIKLKYKIIHSTIMEFWNQEFHVKYI